MIVYVYVYMTISVCICALAYGEDVYSICNSESNLFTICNSVRVEYTLGGQRVASGEMPILGIGPAAEYSEYSV